MVERYDRGAWSLAELREVPFPELARAIPEVRAVLEEPARRERPRTAPVHTRLHKPPPRPRPNKSIRAAIAARNH